MKMRYQVVKLIFKIGGSTLYDGDDLKVSLISDWIELLKRLRDDGHKIGLVVGGGKPARRFCDAARQLGASNSYQDLLGIEAARQNARLFISGLPEAYPNPPANYQQLIEVTASHDLVIVGGFQPGQSTNAVASLYAEHIGADFLFNISNISKVHDKDPRKFEDTKAFDSLTYKEFADIIFHKDQLPGTYDLFDHIGLDIVSRSNIKLVFLNGKHPEHVYDVLEGKQRGTIIQ